MSDKNFQDYTADEKLDVLLEGVANITLFLMSKYPDYAEEIKSIRKEHNKKLIDELAEQATTEILKKLKGEE